MVWYLRPPATAVQCSKTILGLLRQNPPMSVSGATYWLLAFISRLFLNVSSAPWRSQLVQPRLKLALLSVAS